MPKSTTEKPAADEKAKAPEYEFRVDGESYTLDDFTFAELRDCRKLVRELAEDEHADIYLADTMDLYPTMVYIVRRRGNPDYTIEDALKERFDDVFVKVADARPTPARTRA